MVNKTERVDRLKDEINEILINLKNRYCDRNHKEFVYFDTQQKEIMSKINTIIFFLDGLEVEF